MLELQLGDIIKINAPSQEELHNNTFFIDYIDNEKIKIINVELIPGMDKLREHYIELKNGKITNESIRQIFLLDRSTEIGYARQNGLIPETWLDIYFGGEIPTIITCKIINLEEDMIEILTYPSRNALYIDFAYKGIPENIPIIKIIIRDEPVSVGVEKEDFVLKETENYDNNKNKNKNILSEENKNISSEENKLKSKEDIQPTTEEEINIREEVRKLYITEQDIIFGEDLGYLEEEVEVQRGHERYGLETQIQDFINELLSKIPIYKRDKEKLNDIHQIVERFKLLREQYSNYDKNGVIVNMKQNGVDHKPLINHIEKMDKKLKWIIPIAKITKKLYWDDSDDEEENDDEYGREKFDKTLINEKEILNKVYYDNPQNVLNNNYINFLKNVYTPPFKPNKNIEISNISVNTNIECIIENANVIQGENVSTYKWFVQPYNLGYTALEQEIRNEPPIRKQITENEKINITSLLILPETVVRFSRINLPTTDIMTSSSLNNNYFALWRVLKKNSNIKKRNIYKNLSDNLKNNEEDEKMEKEFLKEIEKYDFKNYINENENDDDNGENDDGSSYIALSDSIKLTEILNKIVPKTKLLFKKMQKYIKNKFSFIDVIKYLEPFMIYTNDITYTQYKNIKYFLQSKIREKKEKRSENIRKYKLIANVFINSNIEYINTIYDLFISSTKENMLEVLIYIYIPYLKNTKQIELIKNKSNIVYSSSEIIKQFIEEDGGSLFFNTLANMSLGLTSHEDIIKTIEEYHLKDVADLEKMKPKNNEKCETRKIAKKYSSIKELEKDNGINDIFYDKEFDDTPYNIINDSDIKLKQNELSPTDFKDYLNEVLIEKYGFEKEISEIITENLILGKKKIENNEYAVLTYTKEKNIEDKIDRYYTEYYRRSNSNWVKDNTINNDIHIDNNIDICNISPDCISTDNGCNTYNISKAEIRKNARNKMLNEFPEIYKKTIEETQQNIAELIEKSTYNIERIKILRELKLRRANELSVWIGKNLNMNETNNKIIISPYYYLLEWIFSQTDYIKKQNDIINFYNKYCREPYGDEGKGWLFCKKTNTKLLPLSLYRIAIGFINSGNNIEKVYSSYGKEISVINNNFMIEMGKICAEFGISNEDGDAIVDKYSGRFLRKKDYSTDEGYDDNGSKISTHEILETEQILEQQILNNKSILEPEFKIDTDIKIKKTIKQNKITEIIYNVSRTLCNNLYIPFDIVEEFILYNTIHILEKNVLFLHEKEEYEKNIKSKMPFEIYRNQFIIWITSSITILAVQCAIPSIKIQKTFSQCIKSFSGFPLHDNSDISSLEYMSCVINKIKTNIAPWNSMKKTTDHAIKLKQFLDTMILKDESIQTAIKKKKEYILKFEENILTEENFITEKYRIKKWVHFYPPLVPISLGVIKNISPEFFNDIEKTTQYVHKEQRKQLYILNGKIKQYSFGIIQSINNIIINSEPLLQSANKSPFIENNCCSTNGISTHNCLSYFIEKDNDILLYETNIIKINKVLNKIRIITKPSLLFNNQNLQKVYPLVTENYNTPEIIYDTIIHYCKYGLDTPIPNEYLPICPTKYEGFKRSWNTTEKFDFFKENGKTFNYSDMKNIMNLTNKKNIIKINLNKIEDTRIINFNEILLQQQDQEQDKNKILFLENEGEILKQLLIKCTTEKTISNENLNNLHRNLENIVSFDNINSMGNYILTFLTSNISLNDKKKYKVFLQEYGNWKTDEIMKNNLDFYKNSILFISKIAPQFLILKLFNKNIGRERKHWKLSDNHTFIINKIVDDFNMKNDYNINIEFIQEALTEIHNLFRNVDLFINNIQFFDIKTRIKIYKYLWFRILFEYIKLTENENYDNENINNENNDNIKIEDNIRNIIIYFLNNFNKNKKNLDKTYDDVLGGAMNAKHKEKEELKARFEKMDNDQRKVEKTLMELKLGVWNKGNSKAVFKYNKKAFDEETSMFAQQIENEKELGIIDNITKERVGFDTFDDNFDDNEYDNNNDNEYNSDMDEDDNNFYGRGNIDIQDIPADGEENDNDIDDDYNIDYD